MRICDRCNREVTPYEQVTHDCWSARNFAKTWVLPKDVMLVDADYQFAEAYAAWLGAPDVARFNDDDIRREGLPEDVFGLLHDLAYHRYGRDIYSYVSGAQEILRGAEPDATKVSDSENPEQACTHCEWTHGYHRHGCPNFKFIKQGAESADIGKLDRVDDKSDDDELMPCGHFNYRGYCYAADDFGCTGCDGNFPPDMPKSGSAETGGEKADV
jgi:hypothetical protein